MTGQFKYSWEEAVLWIRSQPEQADLVNACYYDDPLELAAERYYLGEEWKCVQSLLATRIPGRVLDIGAGRGISSYAFAKSGCEVTALEPNPSSIVGGGAIKSLSEHAGVPIEVVQSYGETLPLPDAHFDLVYGRAVFHHAQDIKQLCCEAERVLKPGGMLIFTREHVISKAEDLPKFLDAHALHNLYGGENAYLLKDYLKAIQDSGLRLEKVLKPYDSAINYAPTTPAQIQDRLASKIQRFIGATLAGKLVRNQTIFNLAKSLMSELSHAPGRLYTFVAVKQ